MPKCINGIVEKIYQAAFDLFTTKGYQQVTMKMIAQNAGLSVGTLYNYFINKQDLFLNVFRQSLEQTHAALDGIIEQGGDTYKFITALYDEMVRLKELGRVILSENIDHEIFSKMQDYLFRLMRTLVYKAEEKKDLKIADKDKDRVIRLLMITLYDFTQEFPEEKEQNIDFICRLVEKLK